MNLRSLFYILPLLTLAASPAIAQDAPSPAPAAVPARYVLSLPPGFILVEGARGKVICEPADRNWVQQTVSAAAATTRPSTMPVDLLTRWETAKPDVLAQMAADYAIDDTAPLAKELEKSLTDEVRKLQNFVPPVFFLVTTEAKLKELLKTEQWVSRSFSYNRLADDVVYRTTVGITTERPMDDTVVSAFYEVADGPQARTAKLTKALDTSAAEIDQVLSGRAMFITHTAMIDAIVQTVFRPMQLPRDQQWFGVGLPGATSADYAQKVVGSPRKELLLLISAELRNNPIRPRTINLLDPADPTSLRRQYAAAYADAYRRKCVAATLKIVEKNRAALPELMRSLRQNPCKTGQELLERITQITGVDLTEAVAAR